MRDDRGEVRGDGEATEGRAPTERDAAPEARDRPLWRAAGRRAVLSVAETAGPLLLAGADWWVRGR